MFENNAKKILQKAGIEVNGNNPWDIQVKDKSGYIDTALFGTLGFGDAYINKKWEVEKMDVFFEKILKSKSNNIGIFFEKIQRLRDWVINTQAGKKAFEVGEKHYDLGNEMYGHMLGESMGYSAGFYLKENNSLEEAQYEKFDRICRKLKLEPGMNVLEIGAGWGTFAKHAAKNYGVSVVGLTVSEEQKKFAEKRCEGLDVKFLLLDYQKIGSGYNNYFDRVVSIEMIEAVGKKNFNTYFEIISRTLKDNGLCAIQAIMGSGEHDTFISTRIFPNGILPSLLDISKNIEGKLKIKEVESFGSDYDKTLMSWDKNFRDNWDKIKNIKSKEGKYLYDEKFYRMWRYYLMCCAGSFRAKHIDVWQIVFYK